VAERSQSVEDGLGKGVGRYQSKAAQASGHNASGAVLVVARMPSDDLRWLGKVGKYSSYLLYTEPDGNRTEERRDKRLREKPLTRTGGSTRECGAYLTYIVDHYDSLPDVSVFVQGSPMNRKPSCNSTHGDWHSDWLIMNVLKNISHRPKKVEWCSLNTPYKEDWKANSTHPRGSWYVRKWRSELALEREKDPGRFSTLSAALPELIPEEGVQCFCCAQFAASRERLRARSLALYKELLDFVMEDTQGAAQADTLGNHANFRCALMERAWHTLLGEPATCPKTEGFCGHAFQGSQADRRVIVW
jgi:hypothetical protein